MHYFPYKVKSALEYEDIRVIMHARAMGLSDEDILNALAFAHGVLRPTSPGDIIGAIYRDLQEKSLVDYDHFDNNLDQEDKAKIRTVYLKHVTEDLYNSMCTRSEFCAIDKILYECWEMLD